MPSQNIHVVQDVGTLEELYEQVAKLQKTLRYLLDGNLDFENIRAKGIIAETIDVDELSAITANMGKLTSGEIYGAYIATAEGTYPRAEMSNTQKLFGTYSGPNTYVKIESNPNMLGAPMINFGFEGSETWITQVSTGLLILNQVAGGEIFIEADEVVIGGSINLGGTQNLRYASVPGPSDPDEAVIYLNLLIARLSAMGILP